MPVTFAAPLPTPGYPGTYPAPAFQQPAAGQPYAPQTPTYPWTPNSAPANTLASNPQRIIYRAQADDDERPVPRRPQANPRPPALNMPTPAQLGLDRAQPSESKAVDWTNVHQRLDQLGATCFHLERPAADVFHVTCLLPTGQLGRSHRIETQANSEAEVIRLTLEQAEKWSAGR